MFKEKTFVVIGAGASTEINIPDGEKLKHRIAHSLKLEFEDYNRLTSGDRLIYAALKLKVNNQSVNPYLADAHHICNAMPLALSIDNFVDTQPSNKNVEFLSKLAIVNEIIKAERESTIYADPFSGGQNLNFNQIGKTWLKGFFKLMTENCSLNDLPRRLESLVLVIFNYDRSVEHFLYHALQVYYKIDPNAAAEIVNSMQIYHPYGTAGGLQWQKTATRHPYGLDLQPGGLLNLASQIRTFTEGTDPASTNIENIHQGLREAAIVIFLGFAFHPLNMRLLNPTSDNLPFVSEVRCFATAYDHSNSDVEVIEEQLQSLLHRSSVKCEINNQVTCEAFLKHYWKSLSLS